MGNFIRSSQNVNIDVSRWKELSRHNYEKIVTDNDELSLQEFFENKFGQDLEEVLMAGDIIYNHIKGKSKADYIDIDFLCKSEEGFLHIDSPHYLFGVEECWIDVNDPGTTRNIYSVRFNSLTRQPPEIHSWKGEIVR